MAFAGRIKSGNIPGWLVGKQRDKDVVRLPMTVDKEVDSLPLESLDFRLVRWSNKIARGREFGTAFEVRISVPTAGLWWWDECSLERRQACLSSHADKTIRSSFPIWELP